MTSIASARRTVELDLRKIQREQLNENVIVMSLRHRAEMLMMADGDFYGATEVTHLLKEAIEEGSIIWPRSPYAHGRHDPYSGGVGQHLAALRGTYELLESAKDVSKSGSFTDFRLTPAARKLLPRFRQEQKRLRVVLFECECGGEKDAIAAAFCPPCRKAKAPELLPEPAADFEHVARIYERSTGCEVAFGVTDDLKRVIRVQTLRGIVEHELDPEMSWYDAVDKWLGD